MSRDEIRNHLEFFGELGIDGVRREPEWRDRVTADAPRESSESVRGASLSGSPGEPEGFAPHVSHADHAQSVTVFASQGEALDALRAEIGHACTRCKLHT